MEETEDRPKTFRWWRKILAAISVTLLAFVGFVIWPQPPLPPGSTADEVRVVKSARRLTLLRAGVALKAYRVALGADPKGHKQQAGDERTPEGRYTIAGRNAQSRFHRALRVSYPNAADVAGARKRGVSPGGDIMIHGIRKGFGWIGPLHRFVDWTDGCIAVTDVEMDEIWRAVADGTPIEILP